MPTPFHQKGKWVNIVIYYAFRGGPIFGPVDRDLGGNKAGSFGLSGCLWRVACSFSWHGGAMSTMLATLSYNFPPSPLLVCGMDLGQEGPDLARLFFFAPWNLLSAHARPWMPGRQPW
jgi:hypothetical protein